jgi:hypothetical protein
MSEKKSNDDDAKALSNKSARDDSPPCVSVAEPNKNVSSSSLSSPSHSSSFILVGDANPIPSMLSSKPGTEILSHAASSMATLHDKVSGMQIRALVDEETAEEAEISLNSHEVGGGADSEDGEERLEMEVVDEQATFLGWWRGLRGA